MAVYKVIQDIEAEDKLFGPLTLRQFIYGGVGALCLYLSYLFATHGAAFMLVLFLPIVAASGFFAFPWRRDQPTEVWALAKIRFLFKPRRRIWNQSGVKELVTITAPKQIVVDYTNGLSQAEVRSRLHALATTIDTRGWAIKNTNLNTYTQSTGVVQSDRLVGPALLPKPMEDTDIQAADDILDEQNNANAQRLQSMIEQKAKAHREALMATMQQPAAPQPPVAPPAQQQSYWFLNQPSPAAQIPNNMVTFNTQVVTPGTEESAVPGAAANPTQDEANLLAEIEARKRTMDNAYTGHMHTIKPLSEQGVPAQQPAQPAVPSAPAVAPATGSPTPPQTASAPVTPAAQTAILQLASNDDLNVATLAREAERATPQDEVVIKLH